MYKIKCECHVYQLHKIRELEHKFNNTLAFTFPAPSLADGGTFQGCYNDKAERALKAHFQELSLLQSPGLCIDVCTRNGFEYAGLTGYLIYSDLYNVGLIT